jgi:hypothetical protein
MNKDLIMRVRIEKVFPPDEKELYSVEFFYTIRDMLSSADEVRDPRDSQNLIGKWVGGIPKINRWYDVEISVDDELLWGQNVIQSEHSEASIKSPVAGTIVLQGLRIYSLTCRCERTSAKQSPVNNKLDIARGLLRGRSARNDMQLMIDPRHR